MGMKVTHVRAGYESESNGLENSAKFLLCRMNREGFQFVTDSSFLCMPEVVCERLFSPVVVSPLCAQSEKSGPFRKETFAFELTYLNVSKIMVKSTNFPKRGTTSEVGGIISASSKKKTVNESKIEMDRLT